MQLGDGTNQDKNTPTKITPCPLSDVFDETLNPIKVYPNPTTGFLQLEGAEAEMVEIYDCLGRIQMTFLNPYESIDISAAPVGIYIVKIIIKDKQYTIRIIKEQ